MKINRACQSSLQVKQLNNNDPPVPIELGSQPVHLHCPVILNHWARRTSCTTRQKHLIISPWSLHWTIWKMCHNNITKFRVCHTTCTTLRMCHTTSTTFRICHTTSKIFRICHTASTTFRICHTTSTTIIPLANYRVCHTVWDIPRVIISHKILGILKKYLWNS